MIKLFVVQNNFRKYRKSAYVNVKKIKPLNDIILDMKIICVILEINLPNKEGIAIKKEVQANQKELEKPIVEIDETNNNYEKIATLRKNYVIN